MSHSKARPQSSPVPLGKKSRLPSYRDQVHIDHSRGIGAGIAILLAKRGANVVVNYVSEGSKKRAQEVADEITKIGTKAVLCQASVSNLDEIPRLVNAALGISETGKIEILIHKYAITENTSALVG